MDDRSPEAFTWETQDLESAGPEAAGAEATGLEAAGREAEEPEAAGREAEGPEAARPEAEESEAAGPEAEGPAAEEPEARGMEVVGPAALGLEVLGLHRAPRDHPLLYPGAWPEASGLLDGDRLLPLDSRDGSVRAGRAPVLAVGSNACPGQLRHKMTGAGIVSPVPMVKCRVTGLGIGVSAHVSVMGYVSASPVHAPDAVRELFVTWFDAAQLAVIDASEPAYDRAWLSGSDIRIETDTGEPLSGAFVYVNRHGVLHDGTGALRGHAAQHALLTELLGGSARLRELFGGTPDGFVARARADRSLCARGTRVFAEEGWVTASGLERYVDGRQTGGPATGTSFAPPSRWTSLT